MGGFRVVRSIPIVVAKKGTTAGTILTTNSGVLALGTPVLSPVAVTNMYDVPFSLFFKLIEVQDYTDITQFCDRYKMIFASIIAHNSNSYGGYGGGVSPYIQYIHDSDDVVVPSIAQFDQKMGSKTVGFDQRGMAKLRTKLRVNGAVYDQSETNSLIGAAIPSRSLWLNSLYPSVPHFGIKGIIRNMYLDGTNSASQVAFQIKVTILGADLQ